MSKHTRVDVKPEDLEPLNDLTDSEYFGRRLQLLNDLPDNEQSDTCGLPCVNSAFLTRKETRVGIKDSDGCLNIVSLPDALQRFKLGFGYPTVNCFKDALSVEASDIYYLTEEENEGIEHWLEVAKSLIPVRDIELFGISVRLKPKQLHYPNFKRNVPTRQTRKRLRRKYYK